MTVVRARLRLRAADPGGVVAWMGLVGGIVPAGFCRQVAWFGGWLRSRWFVGFAVCVAVLMVRPAGSVRGDRLLATGSRR